MNSRPGLLLSFLMHREYFLEGTIALCGSLNWPTILQLGYPGLTGRPMGRALQPFFPYTWITKAV
jgi:hypothetical protein